MQKQLNKDYLASIKLNRSIITVFVLLLLFGACLCANARQSGSNNPLVNEQAVSAKVKDVKADNDFMASLNAPIEEEQQREETPLYVTAFSFLAKLAIVLGLAYATIWGLKKFSGMKNAIAGSANKIRVLENSSLGPNKSLHLVEVGNKKMLISSTPTQISLIAEISSEDLPAYEIAAETQSAGFKDQLSMFLGHKPDTSNAAMSVAQMLRESSGFLQDKVRDVAGVRGKLRNGL